MAKASKKADTKKAVKKEEPSINAKAAAAKVTPKAKAEEPKEAPFSANNVTAQPHSTGDFLVTEQLSSGGYRQRLSDDDPTEDEE